MSNRKINFLIVTLLYLFIATPTLAWQNGSRDTFIKTAHADHFFVQDGALLQDIYFESAINGEAKIQLESWYYKSATDSVKIFRHSSTIKLKMGINHITQELQKGDAFVLPAFGALVKRTSMIPCGSYTLLLSIQKDSLQYASRFDQNRDTLISIQSPVIKGINNILEPASNNLFPAAKSLSTAADKASGALLKNQYRLDRYFKKKGLQQQKYTKDSKEIIDLYADGWFMGRYQLDGNTSLSKQLADQKNSLEGSLESLTGNGLGDNQSLLAQFKELKKNSRENSDLTGEIALSANFSNDQEPNSEQDNNYYEARGSLEFPVFDIPVSLSGYYTTQDKNRKAKASYVHFRYDAEKAKEQLLKLIGSYNKKYEQAITQGASYDMVYGKFVGELQSQKDKAIAGLKQQVDLSGLDINAISEEQLKEAALKKVYAQKDKLQDSLQNNASASSAGKTVTDAASKAQELKRKADEKYAKALEQYNKIMELERKIKKYQGMLDQYRNTNYYDSLMAYGKSKELQNLDGASYKDIAKKASSLLPESKTKNFVTGLTNFDAGMFPKYVSDYTMSGQMLKGVDAGYDIGFAEIGGSYGKTEYIDRNGNVEGYKTYSGRAQFKPLLKQTLGFVYFGYSPGKQLLEGDGFFKDVSVSLPSFRNPVHIVSVLYNGEISKYVHLGGEYAVSTKQGQSEAAAKQSGINDKSAYNIKVEGNIPAQNINIEAAYEHAGKSFENNTLPVLMAGTDRIRMAGKGDLFRSFLTVGVEYNYLVQSSLSSTGNNSKWGFDIATHSKRYPSVSLSYKPFSTFRSFNDTLNIEQKPILGEVWTGKLNYQIKRKDRAIRFTLLYNRNTSSMDTVKYGSALVQFSTIYSYKSTMLALNLGSTDINTDYIETAVPLFNHSKFMNLAASGQVLPQLMLSGGTDLALASAQISRYGFFVGTGYSFKKLPVMIRANFRFSNYRLDEMAAWKQLYSGGIELAWRFKMKIFDK
jgi:hypothetical protein